VSALVIDADDTSAAPPDFLFAFIPGCANLLPI
jgi:hypothetical protein